MHFGDFMTINDLLQLESMKKSRIVTENIIDDVNITGVNVMEVPDIINWVKKGEFLMTAGYSYRNKPDAFAMLIPKLAAKGIAVIGIKIHRYFDIIPQQIIDNANESGLTVIEISEDVVFSNVVREVIQSLMSSEYMLVSGMLDKITTLSGIILSGKGLDYFIETLSEYMGNPIVLARRSGECISVGLPDEDAYITGRDEDLLYSNIIEKHDWTTLMVGVRQYKAYYYNILQQNEQIAGLYLIEKNREIANEDIYLIEQCSFIIGMELQSETVRTRVEMKYIDQFLQNWVLGKIESESSFATQSEACNVNISGSTHYIVCIVHMDSDKTREQKKSIMIRFRKNFQMYSDLYVTFIDDEILAIIPDEKEKRYSGLILEFANSIDDTARLCIGKNARDYYNLSDSYKDAGNILKVSIRYRLSDKILHYRDTGVYSLLYLIPMGKELDEYMELYLKPLLDYDSKHQTDMYETLKVYLDTKCNVKATSERLFMHYNTISYRLERISHILNMDISDHEIQFSLKMAIKINDMYL